MTYLNRLFVPLLLCAFAFGSLFLGVHPDPLALAAIGFLGTMEVKDLVPILDDIQKNAKERFEKLTDVEKKQLDHQTEMISIQQRLDKVSKYMPGGESFSFAHAERNDPELQELFTKGFAGIVSNRDRRATIELPAGALRMEAKAALVNATGLNQPLVQADRLSAIIAPAQRRLTLRDIIPVAMTDSNMIEYCKETAFTNNAGIVYSSPNTENVTKPESSFTFALASASVVTIAHWTKASKQILEDASQLQAYLDNRLTYGLKLAEQDEILNGDGSSAGHLAGLMNQATPYAGPGAVSADTQMDTLRRAIGQLEASEHAASAIVLNPADWMKIELLKDSQGKYIFGDPAEKQQPTMWGIPVVVTNQIAATRFLVGDMAQAAMLFDRQQPTMEISREDGDNFRTNMVTILVENRMTMAVFRPLALIRGNFN